MHEEGEVVVLCDAFLLEGLGEAGPAAAAFELLVGAE